MLTVQNFHEYQHRATAHIVKNRAAMLWLDMGLGKTIAALTAFCTLRAVGQVDKVLIVAPLRVCQTVWPHEIKSWAHTRHLRCSEILGSAAKRQIGLHNSNADVYLINYENLGWLVSELQHSYLSRGVPLPFQMIVWDEVSKMKNSITKRGMAARKILDKVPYKVGLTGTPASNGIGDLHGQFLVVDNGDRLGTHITHFREQYMRQDSWSFRWEVRAGAQLAIEKSIQDITLQMSAKDYLTLPQFTVNDIRIQLPPRLMDSYRELETNMITQFEQEEAPHEIVVFNAAALTNKCLQFANGAVYTEVGSTKFKAVHDHKIKALEEIVEGTGDNVLVAYSFKSDLKRITKAFPHAINLSGLSGAKLVKVVADWNAGNIRMLIGHPASMGHGLNLQYGGHTLVWFGLNWSLDLTDQFNARINRQGQKFPVVCHRIMVDGTIEQLVSDSLAEKCVTETQLRNALARYVRGHKRPAPINFI